jgi:hypothetical protein
MKNTLMRSVLQLSAIALIGLALSSPPAFAQSTYTYTGNPFTLFSCGPNNSDTATMDCSTPFPANPLTSYTATDHVTATLTLATPLPANLAITDVQTSPGFALSMNDGEHTVTNSEAVGMFAEVSTDGTGQIVQWRLVINTGGALNGGIATINKGASVFDSGTIACCDPTVPGNLALIFSGPGTWNSGIPNPATLTTNLISLLSNPLLGLTGGQISSLKDKLNNALASIEAGLNKQAINQLNAFISSIQSSVKTGKISAQTGTTLITAANAIIAQL